ncbi:MAG: hypothetical protein FD176_691 [Rhodospirillaceae bacterium]|nr:MAG: hypothetical protein FD176_691 [Rhodospirillaceae bacterium]TNC98778.1 MAG: hypothetical protein FD119_249 [Stygiobacter sp.]
MHLRGTSALVPVVQKVAEAIIVIRAVDSEPGRLTDISLPAYLALAAESGARSRLRQAQTA